MPLILETEAAALAARIAAATPPALPECEHGPFTIPPPGMCPSCVVCAWQEVLRLRAEVEQLTKLSEALMRYQESTIAALTLTLEGKDGAS